MRQIKRLKKHRWFIWAVVLSIAGLGFLAAHVYSIASRDEAAVPVIFEPSNRVVSNVSTKLPVVQTQASYVVRNIPAVKEFIRTHAKARVVPDEQIDPEGAESAYWPVHVFEDFGNRTKTYGWFKVYVESGVISKQ